MEKRTPMSGVGLRLVAVHGSRPGIIAGTVLRQADARLVFGHEVG